MEEKKTSKISISTVLLILAMIVIAVMGLCIFKLNSDKNAESQKAAALQSQVEGLKGTVSSLQEQTDKIPETTTSSTTTQDQTETTSETSGIENTYNYSDLKEFWTNFRAAVLSGDYNEIKQFVKFPLQEPGPYDSDPVKKIKEEDFEEVFKDFLKQYDNGETTIFDWIKDHEMPEMLGGADYDNNGSGRYTDIARVEGDWARFSDMVMEKDESGYWKVTTIYVSEE
ncbi:MAG: hypothetical protein J6X33_02590 [Clostridiales bacterium]|nr:hypothetical protein [Clostridiales bacterium]